MADKEYAFPMSYPRSKQLGLEMRDYFAAMAIPGLLRNDGGFSSTDEESLARKAYQIADAMMEQRKKEE